MIIFGALSIAVILMLLGTPVAFSFLFISLLLSLIVGIDTSILVSGAIRSVDSFTLLALPLFILLGAWMRESDLSSRLIEFSKLLVGKMHGGLGSVTILCCAIFGAISGSAAAAITSIGAFMMPELEKDGYSRGYATGLVAASSLLSLLIPPSIPMIIFAMSAQISIKDAFLSTIVPAVLIIIVYIIINTIYAMFFKKQKNDDVNHSVEVDLKKSTKMIAKAKVIRQASTAILLPVIVLGGIYGGIFTATEAAAIGCILSLAFGFFITRKLTIGKTYSALWQSMYITGTVIILLFSVAMLTRVFVIEGVPQNLAGFLVGFSSDPNVTVLMIIAILLVMGMLVDDISGNILSAALILPSAVSVGIDPVHFAAISVITLSIGNLTPPVAPMLYLAGMVGDNTPVSEFLKPTMVFMALGAIPVVILVAYFPALSLGVAQIFR